jgi:hypothetical protein
MKSQAKGKRMAEPLNVERARIAPNARAWVARLRGAATLRLTLLSALLLTGCVTDNDKGLCPSANILAPTSALTVFRANAPQDPSGELYTVWMSDVKSDCDYDKDEISTASRMRIHFKASRPAGGEGGNYRVPYFVAVTHKGSRVMTKKLFIADVSFAPGQTSTEFVDEVGPTEIKIGRDNKVGEYEILMGFQLTQAQLDYNTKNHHYAP